MDVLSDVIRVVRLSGAVFFTTEFSSPWAIESSPELLASFGSSEAECFALFHILIEGDCLVECDGHPPARMSTGDVIVFPNGDPHRMRSADGTTWARIDSVLPAGSGEGLPVVCFGGGGHTSRFICGILNCDQRFNPLFAGLPTMLLVRAGDDYTSIEVIDGSGQRPARVPQGSGTWLATTLKFTVNEASAARPGSAAMLGRLTELMFVEILREYMQQLPPDDGGWLAGLNDPQVGKALRLLHLQPTRDWTVDDLAREVAISRSALAQRFSDLVGEAPIRYLASWRIQLAKQMLREGTQTVQEVATHVGYESEAAFNRAFKRATGSPPAAWRKGAAATS
jgi:AraC-like DNA-binding protein